jgi:hypothetical protein
VTVPDGAAGPAGLVLPGPAGPAGEPPLARLLARGIQRTFAALGQASLTELILATGRRADVLAVDRDGTVTIVEIKSGVPDFRADRKWPDYTAFCDRFLFAVPAGFPDGILPPTCGLMVADAYEAVVVREPAEHRLTAARRKAVTLRFALQAAGRLQRLTDPCL